MTIITLTTDLGLKDFYIATVKGYILRHIPNATIIDISHEITPFNIAEASFIIRNCYQDFPANTIHLVSVESDNEKNIDYLLIQYKSQYIIAKDNGLIPLIIDNTPDKIIKLNIKSNDDLLFPLKNIMARAACRLAVSRNEYDLGTSSKEITNITTLNPILERDIIRGTIIHIDSYGNAITNIRKSHIERYDSEKKMNISFGRRSSIEKISELYSDVAIGEKLCLFGTSGLLEIAINKGSAVQLLGLELKNIVLIEFI
jgi:S-adenosyl-L-methionine hydrolase (adenosine-forming)